MEFSSAGCGIRHVERRRGTKKFCCEGETLRGIFIAPNADIVVMPDESSKSRTRARSFFPYVGENTLPD